MFKIILDLSHLKFSDFFEFTKLEPTRAQQFNKLYDKGGKSWNYPPFIRLLSKTNFQLTLVFI